MSPDRSRFPRALVLRVLAADAVIGVGVAVLRSRRHWDAHPTGDALQLLGIAMAILWLVLVSGKGVVLGRRTEPISRLTMGRAAQPPQTDPKRRRALPYPSVLAASILPIIAGTLLQTLA